MQLQAEGLEVNLPTGWEGTISGPSQRGARAARAIGHDIRPVMHLANFALPTTVADFGSEAVAGMRPGQAFISLVEYGPDEAHTPLFAEGRVRRSLALRDLSPRTLLRTLPDQVGHQSFATERGRAFCLYVVVAGQRTIGRAIGEVNGALKTLRVEA